MSRITIFVVAFMVMTGCQKQAETTTRAGLNFQVDKLFTVDGCTVYRFEDGAYARYFTNCSGSTEWEESCGRNCMRPNGVAGTAQ